MATFPNPVKLVSPKNTSHDPVELYESSVELKPGETNGYLKRKGVGANGLARMGLHFSNPTDPCLVIPMYDQYKNVTNLQYIFDSPRIIRYDDKEESEETDKAFLGGRKKKGRISVIGPDIWDKERKLGRIYIAEGFATAATVHELTGDPVVIAFDAGNLKYAAETVRKIVGPEPLLVFAADDDFATSRAGETGAAEAAYRAGNAAYVLPPFTQEEKGLRGKSISDFNDLLMLANGKERAREALTLTAGWVWPSVRPTIELIKGNESEVVKKLVKTLLDPRMSNNGGSEGPFKSGEGMAYVSSSQLRFYDPTYLLQIVSERALLVEYNSKGGVKSATTPKPIVEMLLKSENMGEYRPLKAVMRAQAALREDGTLVTQPGYDPELQIYLVGGIEGDDGVVVPGLEECKETLAEAYAGIRVKSPVYARVVLAHLLTLLTTHLTPIRPAFLFYAPGAGFGKSTAALINFIIAGIGVENNGPPSLEWKSNEDGMEKQIASAMVAGKELFFDNIDNGSELGLNCLSRVISQPTISFRLLGRTHQMDVANNRVMTFTGNNVSVTNDLARRVMVAEFGGDSVLEGGKWDHIEWATYYKANRERYLLAALGLLSHYMRSDDYRDRLRIGATETVGFPEWERIVAGTIRWVYGELGSGADITSVLRDTYEDAQTEDSGRNAVRLMAGIMGTDKKYSASELLVEIQRADMKIGAELCTLLIGGRVMDLNNRNLGVALAKIRDKKSPDGVYTFVRKMMPTTKVNAYFVVKREGV